MEKKLLNSENGQVIIFVSLILTAVLATLALVVDIGDLYLAKRKLQTAVDAAALAAAMQLAENKGETEALQAAREYLAKNYASAQMTSFNVQANSVEVRAKSDVSQAFSRLLGYKSLNISAQAQARYQVAVKVSRLVPFIVPYQQVFSHVGPEKATDFEFGADRPLNSDGTTENAQKAFFWLTDFNSQSGGTPDFYDWIVNGYPQEVAVGTLANGEGVRSSLAEALNERLKRDPTLILPVYDYTENSGSNGLYHVVGFVEFYLQGFKLNGQPKTVTGYFTEGTVAPGAGGEGAADLGVRAVWLSQ